LTALIIVAALILEVLLIVFVPIVGWAVLGFIGFLLILLLVIPIGVHACYVGGDFSLAAKISAFEIKLLPKNEKKKKTNAEPKPKPEKKADKKEEQAKVKKSFPFNPEETLELLKKAIKGLGKFGKLTVHKFMLHYLAAGSDPYNTAMSYGYVNAALSALAPVCRQNLRIKDDVDVWTDVDFTKEKTFIEAELSISLRLIQLLHVGLVIAFGALHVLIRNRRRLAKANKAKSTDNNTEENKEITDKEERTDSNG